VTLCQGIDGFGEGKWPKIGKKVSEISLNAAPNISPQLKPMHALM